MQHNQTMRFPVRAGHIGVMVTALVIGGCSSFGGSSPSTASGTSSPSFGQRLSNFFGSRSSQSNVSQAPNQTASQPPDFECPGVDIRTGTSTYTVSAPGTEAAALNLRYQATIAETARECKLVGGNVVMRVGVEGRIILGPAGGPTQAEVPLRLAVVQEGPDPKTILTKLRWVSVPFPPGETNFPFIQIDEDISFPLPRGNLIDAYVVYVGFDRAATKEPEKKKPAPKPQPPTRRRGL